MTMPDHLIAGQVPPCRIWLDGVEQTMVVEACVSAGWIIRNQTDANGQCIIAGDEFATEKLFGAVTCDWSNDWTEHGKAWLAAGCPPIKDWKPE